MTTKICPEAENCHHYKSGGREPPNMHVRLNVPCNHWLGMDCKVMPEWATILKHTRDEVMACNLEKVRKIKGKK